MSIIVWYLFYCTRTYSISDHDGMIAFILTQVKCVWIKYGTWYTWLFIHSHQIHVNGLGDSTIRHEQSNHHDTVWAGLFISFKFLGDCGNKVTISLIILTAKRCVCWEFANAWNGRVMCETRDVYEKMS